MKREMGLIAAWAIAIFASVGVTMLVAALLSNGNFWVSFFAGAMATLVGGGAITIICIAIYVIWLMVDRYKGKPQELW